jgi:hypothetical protein
MDRSPWKTPFGRLLIVSSIVAAIAGFVLASGVTTSFRGASAQPDDAIVVENDTSTDNLTAYPPDTSGEQSYTAETANEVPAAQTPAQEHYYDGPTEASQEGSSSASSSNDERDNDPNTTTDTADQGGTDQ